MLPLEDVRVLDLSRVGPMAYCTMILGDMGAEVIKIESPPEAGRAAGSGISPATEKGRKEAAFYAFNRNKKSIGLNLRTDEGRKIFYELAKKSDVILEGFRPGVTKRLGVDYERISKINPKIIYCSISGYGQDGPYQQLPGHDINYISTAGALNLFGLPGGPPVFPLNLIGDFAGGTLHAVVGILLAMVARAKTGKGQYVDISMTDGVLGLLTQVAGRYFHTGKIPERGKGALGGAFPYYNTYKTKDGKYISLGCLEPWFWENLCRELKREDLIPFHFKPEHIDDQSNMEKWQDISSQMEKIFITKTKDEWLSLLSQKNVAIASVNTLEEVFADPQIKERNMLAEIDHPTLGKIKQVGIAFKLSDTPGKIRSLSPLLGEHTKELLGELGYTDEDIRSLEKNKVIYWAT